MDLYGMCTLTRGSLSDFFGSLAHGLPQCGGRGPKIIRKSMLKRGAQKGGSKGEHKWLEHSLFCHFLLIRIEPARSKRCLQLSTTFHKNLTYHRKCLHLGSRFGSFLKHIAERNPKSQDGWCQTTMLRKS